MNPDKPALEQAEALDALLREERVFRPLPQTLLAANVKPQELAEAVELARTNPLRYWEMAAEELEWHRRWDAVLDDREAPFYKWFVGAKLNIVHNALDRHIQSVNKNKLALIWEGEAGDCRKFTYYELFREVNRLANALRSLGINKGERVVIYMPNLPETVISMLAVAKIGAVQSLVFAGFSAKALRERIEDTGAKAIITADGFYRNGRVINLKQIVDEALTKVSRDLAESVIVVARVKLEVEMSEGRDLFYDDLVRQERPDCPTEIMGSEDPLFLLHTSGTSGRPKAVVHTHAGYMVGLQRSMNWVFDAKPTDIHWCTADPGWITGHSYVVFGPLLCGLTSVLYEGHPLYPQADRLWSIVARYGVNILYTTPTFIRMLMRFGPQYPKKHDLSTLRLLATVGEPISPEAWVWFHKNIGRGECPLLDTWWQTESGMCMLSPLPVSLLKPGSVGKPLPGIEADVVDRQGNSLPPGQGGFLVIKRPWPSMLRGLYQNPEAYRESYWDKIPGVFFAGDVARKDEDGFFFIQGRADDVLNLAGHRIGNAELESALSTHRAVAEAAVIGIPDRIKGESAKAFIVPNENAEADYPDKDELVKELKEHLKRELGPIAILKYVEFKDNLPHTRSGKILRRLLKAEELGLDPGDISTLEEE